VVPPSCETAGEEARLWPCVLLQIGEVCVVKGSGEVHVEGEVQRVTFESKESGFRVVKLSVEGQADRLAVVGTFPALAVGARVRVRGTMVTDKKHGLQLRAVSVTELLPCTIDGVERYLASGVVPGIGEKLAKRIVSVFKLETLRVLDEEPHRLGEVVGLGEKRARAVAKAWTAQRAQRDVMVFLQARGASSSLAMRVWKRYGPAAVDVVSRNPYVLAIDVSGVGFKTADRLAASLGIARDSPERLQAGLLQALHDATEAGHVYTRAEELVMRAGRLLELDLAVEGVQARLALGSRTLGAGGHAATETIDGDLLVYEGRMLLAETRLARRAVELARATSRPLRGLQTAMGSFERDTGVTLAEEQREAIARAASSAILVITGGPGVGKTTIVRAILAMLDASEVSVRLAAPTGRAAKRMSEATGRAATTLHRLLEFDPRHGIFKRDAKGPVAAGAVIVDEASMIDLLLADALFQAIEPGTRLILVGDVDQLPSVGPGAVLRDVLASSGIPYVRLRRIFRQAERSLIVTNAHRINAGEPPVPPPTGAASDFFIIERHDAESATRTIVELVQARIPQKFGMDPVRDIQVLTPMHRGVAGSHALNAALQQALNPQGESLTRGGRVFRLGDKVMQLKNDYDRGIFNGDVGIVTRVLPEQDTLYVGYDPAPRDMAPTPEREVVYDSSTLDELTVAYAQSVHKAQGSEYPAVVIPVLTSHFVMLSRNLLYTAVTRGKRLVVLVCDPRAIKLALSLDRRDERRSRLSARIAHGGL
jgi:exodeoxyribonuclease V alpha subunit